MKLKIPDIKRTQEVVGYLIKKQAEKNAGDGDGIVTANFPLADSLYASAKVATDDTVYLWLGANVMLQHTYAEAETLLKDNIDAAHEKLRTTDSDLLFLRDQITTAEVNIARLFNHDVQ